MQSIAIIKEIQSRTKVIETTSKEHDERKTGKICITLQWNAFQLYFFCCCCCCYYFEQYICGEIKNCLDAQKNTHTQTCKMCPMKVTDRIHSKGNELCQFIFGLLNTKCWWWILLDPKSAGPPSFIKRFKSPAWAPKCSRCTCVLQEKEKMRNRKGETIKEHSCYAIGHFFFDVDCITANININKHNRNRAPPYQVV